MMISLVMKENSVGLGQASVAGAVGTGGSVVLPVGKGGPNDPVRSSVDVDPVNPGVVEFTDAGGMVKDTGGAVVEFDGTLDVSTMVVVLVDVGGRIVERLPVENDGTVDQLIDEKDSVVVLPVGVGLGAVELSNGRVVGGIRVTLPLE